MSARRIHPAVIHGGVVAVGGATLAVSAYFQYRLGMLAGSAALAWTLPVALDAGGSVASACWLIGHGELRRWGRFIAVALVVASTAANVLAHGLSHGWPWSPLGVVYPLVFFAMVKLVLLYQEQRADMVDAEQVARTATDLRRDADHDLALAEVALAGAEQARRDVVLAQRAVVSRAASHAPSQRTSRRKSQPASREERRQWVRQERVAGRDPRGADVDKHFGPPRSGAAIVREVDADKPALHAVERSA